MTIQRPLERKRDSSPARRGRRRPVFSLVLAAVAGAFLLLISAPNIGVALRAARTDGAPGTFTAERTACVSHLGHQSCTWRGTFAPAGGGPDRQDIYLYGNPDLSRGQQVSATDAGRSGHVYAGPSREWILIGLALIAGVGLLLPPAGAVVRLVTHRFGSGAGGSDLTGAPRSSANLTGVSGRRSGRS